MTESSQLEATELNPTDLNPTAQIVSLVYQVREARAKVDLEKRQKAQAADYYADRVRKAEQRVEFLEGQMLGIMESNVIKSVATPLGTAFLTTRKRKEVDQAALEEYCIKGGYVKTVPDVARYWKVYTPVTSPVPCIVVTETTVQLRGGDQLEMLPDLED